MNLPVFHRTLNGLLPAWINLASFERSLRDPLKILERSLRDRFPRRLLTKCFGPSQNFEETVAIVEITERSLYDNCDCLALIERPSRDLAFFNLSPITQQSPILCKRCKKDSRYAEVAVLLPLHIVFCIKTSIFTCHMFKPYQTK